MFSRIRAIVNHPGGYTAVGGVGALILWELLKLIVTALRAVELSVFQSALEWFANLLSHPVPLGYLVIVILVFVTLFWVVRKRLDQWPFGSSRRDRSSELEPSLVRSIIVLRCSGWNPPTNHDEQYTVQENTRLRYELTRLAPGQKYTFYFRFWSEGRAPRWIGITNSQGTNFTSPNGDEVSLSETTSALPNADIRVLDLIKSRFPDFDGSSAVIDRLRLRGDSANLSEVEVSVTIY